jgi:multidrug efflux pump subunit AcrA (membrane-fusion protein)
MEVLVGDPKSPGEMSMASMQLRAVMLMLAVMLVAAGGVGLFVVARRLAHEESPAKGPGRVTLRNGKIVIFKTADTYGIEAAPVQAISWHLKMFIDGRVLPNPHATLDIRAPFAGVVSAGALFRIGAPVQAHEELAQFEARFSPLEKLDLQAKSVEADERFKGAEKVLKIREARLHRLDLLPSGSISRGDLDLASIQLSEAQMQKDIAQTQRDLWNKALERVGKKSLIVPINAPISGEIAEVGAQPGANVEAGQLLVRIVDFRRVLVRLDFPLTSAGAGPPENVEIETPGSLVGARSRDRTPTGARRRARLVGPAPNVEVGLQKASSLYEIVPHQSKSAPNWRPGLYVKARLDDPAEKPQSAIAIPASALLVHKGYTLVYLELRPGRYERREVELLDRDGETLYVSASGWRPGDTRVVVKHAQVLLSEEFRSDVYDE